MANRKKPDPQRRNKPTAPDLRLVVGEVPDVPEWLPAELRPAWDAYWDSDVAAATFNAISFPALTRLFRLYVEEESQADSIMETPTLIGHAGQVIVNPMHRILATTRAEIRALEDRFGANPRAVLNLGIALGSVTKQVEELTAVEVAVDERD